MQNESIDTQNANITDTNCKNEIELGLPLLALFLSCVTFFPLFSEALGLRLLSIIILYVLLAPIVGMIIGIVALCKGKARIGASGIIISIVSIVMPPIYAFIDALFIGVATEFVFSAIFAM